MLVVEGQNPGIEASRGALAALSDLVGETGRPVVWVWRPERQVAFGPRDVNHEGYAAAAATARDHGYAVVERSVGGHPVAHTGGTLAFARAAPIADPRRGLSSRYDDVLDAIMTGLVDLGIDAEPGEPPGAFCPGDHSISAGGKLVGLAQRVTGSFAVVSGVVIVTDAGAVAEVLSPVYNALSLPLDPTSIGSIAEAGGPADPTVVADALEAALTKGHRIESIPLDRLIEDDVA